MDGRRYLAVVLVVSPIQAAGRMDVDISSSPLLPYVAIDRIAVIRES